MIFAEGCRQSKIPLTPEKICEVLTDAFKLECRISILGHIQRGGTPSAFDRNLATLQGCKAVQHFMSNLNQRFSVLIGIKHNGITIENLEECILKVQFNIFRRLQSIN